MKKLLLLMLLIIGCSEKKSLTKDIVKDPEPKFTYMQEVTITTGFLRGQSGKIQSYYFCKALDEKGNEVQIPTNGICYTILLTNGDGTGWNNVQEKDLL